MRIRDASFLLFSVLPIMAALPLGVSAAALYLDPETGSYGRGDTFILQLRLQNDGECLNAVHAEVHYPTDALRAIDFGKGSSILSMWIEEPKIDTEKGVITFSGGIPGGYCGRIPGDPVVSNVLGKLVFTALSKNPRQIQIRIASSSEVYLNDGLGTKAPLTLRNAVVTLGASSTQSENPWLSEVKADTLPPDPFTIQVQSTGGVFGGKYFLIFSTVDKQSGIDHYEIFENSFWKPITSPYVVKDQLLREAIQIKAIDKAGNARIGEYTPGEPPPREFSFDEIVTIIVVIVILIGALVARLYLNRRAKSIVPPTAPPTA